MPSNLEVSINEASIPAKNPAQALQKLKEKAEALKNDLETVLGGIAVLLAQAALG